VKCIKCEGTGKRRYRNRRDGVVTKRDCRICDGTGTITTWAERRKYSQGDSDEELYL